MRHRTDIIRTLSLMILIMLAFINPIKADGDFQHATENEQQNVSDSILYHQYLGHVLRFYQADIDSVMYTTDKALVVTRRNNKKMEEIRIVATRAYLLSNVGRFSEALDNYQLAFELAENPDSEQHYWTIRAGYTPTTERLAQLANMHFTYGHLMMLTGNKEGRLYHYRKAREIAIENNDLRNIAYTESGLAMIYLEKEMADSAQRLIESSLRIHEKIDSQLNKSYLLWIQGNIFMRTEQYDKAYASYATGKRSAVEVNNRNGLVINNLGLSQYFQQINDKDSSLYYAYRTYEGRDMQDFQALSFDVALAVENIYQVFEMRNEPDSMLKYLQLSKAARDSLNLSRIDNLLNFQQVLMAQQAEQKEREKQLVIDQTRNRTYAMLVLLAAMVIVTTIIYRSYRQKQRSNRELAATLEELKTTQTQLIHAEKMASLGELTAGIAHEIQNPLNFVNNFAEVSIELIDEVREENSSVETRHALSPGATNHDNDIEKFHEISLPQNVSQTLDDIKQNLEKIHHHGKRADSIVKGMLMHSRGTSGKKEPTDINALADEYLRLAYHGLRAKDKSFNATLVTDLDNTIPRIEAVPQDMGRVLLNLINNAFHAVDAKSHTSPPPQYTPTVTVTTKHHGDRIEMAVKDNGPGIPKNIRNKIFQPFFTTKPTGQGTGLGLSLVYDIVRNHQGEISLESKENDGTTFLIKLPIA